MGRRPCSDGVQKGCKLETDVHIPALVFAVCHIVADSDPGARFVSNPLDTAAAVPARRHRSNRRVRVVTRDTNAAGAHSPPPNQARVVA
jgi:hypothetical protein